MLPADRVLSSDIEHLLELKRASPELGLAPRVESIDRFVQEELERLESAELPEPAGRDVSSQLEWIFYSCLKDAWPGRSVPR
jgi:hypothetical protein